MAGEDLTHRLDWLDEERRKDKTALAKLEEQLKAQTAAMQSQAKQLQELGSQLAQLSVRLQPQKVDELLVRYREESSRALEAMDKRRLELEEKNSRTRAVEKSRIDKTFADMQKQLEAMATTREGAEIVRAEQTRQSALLQEMRKTLDAIQRRDEERTRIISASEEGRRQDIRRMADVQGEQQSARQRMGEIGARMEALESASQRQEGRLSELLTMELERRNAMALWQEQQTSTAAIHERQWKDWERRINEPLAQMEEFLKRLDGYNETFRLMRQTLDEFRALTEKQEQRLREMAEIQRLQEDRLRQDWSTFLADDQKRWTAQSLTREDEWRETNRQFGKTTVRLKKLEGQMEQTLDALQAEQEGDRARLETLANAIREWLARMPEK
jgi:hypothetical protein